MGQGLKSRAQQAIVMGMQPGKTYALGHTHDYIKGLDINPVSVAALERRGMLCTLPSGMGGGKHLVALTERGVAEHNRLIAGIPKKKRKKVNLEIRQAAIMRRHLFKMGGMFGFAGQG